MTPSGVFRVFRTARYHIDCIGAIFFFNGKDRFLLMSNIRFHDAQISLLHKVEVRNFASQACNVKQKGTHL